MSKTLSYSRLVYLGEGVLSCILGLFALILPELFTLGVEQFIGWLFICLGTVQLLFLNRKSTFWSDLCIALVHVFIGVFLVWNPLLGIQSLALWIISQFIFIGLMRLFLAYQIYPQKGWGWLVGEGVAALTAFFIIIFNWPLDAFWLLGFLSGINFLVYGLFQIAFILQSEKNNRAAANS